MKRFLLLIPLLLLVSCTAQVVASSEVPACSGVDLAGFWSGWWHGFMAPIFFWFSLGTNVTIYEVCNSGSWYDFGFCFSGAVNFFFWVILLPLRIIARLS